MRNNTLPLYPIYIPSKNRYDTCLTAKFLQRDGVPFYLVVEPQQQWHYAAVFGEERILVLPWNNRGSVIPARNWIKDHATESGYKRHWQLDDNMREIQRVYKNKRIRCDAGPALRAVEDFTDRYENIAISGLNYRMFVITGTPLPPFHLNGRVYSCTLINNETPHRWRGRYNEDTDMCLQVLSDGWCTILVNAFVVDKLETMSIKGGNTKEIYGGDGRLKMARSLERMWPGVVKVKRRWDRPQHVVDWSRFDTPLKRKKEIELDATMTNDYGLKLKAVKPVKSKRLQQLIEKQ